MTFYFGQQNDPSEWKQSGHSIWVGHPAIARGIVRFLEWLQKKFRRECL
jgi:hypothetical protein